MFLLVTMATEFPPPIRDLQAAAADALRPGYAFFLFPTAGGAALFPLLWNPQRCIAPAPGDIVLVSSNGPTDSDV